MIGPEAERAGTIRYGMAAVAAAASSVVPWASVMVHKSFGVATTAPFRSRQLRAELALGGIRGPAAGGRGGGGVPAPARRGRDPESMRRELEEKLAAARTPFPAAESFAVHDLIDPRETRPLLCQWVEDIQARLGEQRTPVQFGWRP